MTRKDYRLLAECIKQEITEDTHRYATVRSIVSRLCVALHEDNPSFKSDVFVKACGF